MDGKVGASGVSGVSGGGAGGVGDASGDVAGGRGLGGLWFCESGGDTRPRGGAKAKSGGALDYRCSMTNTWSTGRRWCVCNTYLHDYQFRNCTQTNKTGSSILSKHFVLVPQFKSVYPYNPRFPEYPAYSTLPLPIGLYTRIALRVACYAPTKATRLSLNYTCIHVFRVVFI